MAKFGHLGNAVLRVGMFGSGNTVTVAFANANDAFERAIFTALTKGAGKPEGADVHVAIRGQWASCAVHNGGISGLIAIHPGSYDGAVACEGLGLRGNGEVFLDIVNAVSVVSLAQAMAIKLTGLAASTWHPAPTDPVVIKTTLRSHGNWT